MDFGERFNALFENMEEGVALHELVLDEQGRPVNYRILDVNPAYEQHTGVRRAAVVGKLATEAYGTATAPFLEEYGRVGLGGRAYRFEARFQPLDRWFSISVTPFGALGFATLFTDVSERKREQKASEQLGQYFNLSMDLLCAADREGRFLQVNAAWERALGWKQAELEGRPFLDLVHPDDRGPTLTVMARMETGQSNLGFANRYRHKDGSWRWIEWRSGPFLNGVAYAAARDVTDQVEALRRVQRSERLFAEVFHLFPNPVTLGDEEGRLVDLNQAFEQLHGRPRAELLGQPLASIGVWKDPADAQRFREALRETGAVDGMELEMVGAGARPLRLQLFGRRIRVGDESVVLATSHDLTALRAAEAALRESQEMFASVFQLVPDPISLVDLRGVLVDVNQAQADLHGYRVEEMVGRDTRELGLWADPEEPLRLLARFEPSGRVDGVEVQMRHRSGAPLVVLLSARRLAVRGGELVLVVCHDITGLRSAEAEKLKLEQQVMQAQKLESLGVLAGGIAHDFNNLLTGVLGNADLALAELSPVHPARDRVEDIERASRQAAELCRQMLAYSGKGRFVVQPFSLNELVQEMAHLLAASISKKAVLRYELPPGLPAVMADATQIRQVVMNLIINASEAIGDRSGFITLSTGFADCSALDLAGLAGGGELSPGQYLFLEVADTGVGMDPETQARIFEPFFSTKFTGRGLGLAAVLGIVRGHQGGIRVESRKGHGTRFRLLFPPCEESATGLGSKPASQAEWRSHGLVLLADDEETVRSLGRRILERTGFKVLTAADGREALELFQRHHEELRLVLLDVTMPHLDGEACFREMRALDPRVKVLLTSGYNEQEIIARFGGEAPDGFVQKPYQRADLLPKLRAALGE